MSRKVSPPGRKGIESVTALGNKEASPISNFFCKGYRKKEKYSIENIERDVAKYQKKLAS